MQGKSHHLWWLPGPGFLKQLPGKQEALKADFLEMKVEAASFKSSGLRGPFAGSETVFLLQTFVCGVILC